MSPLPLFLWLALAHAVAARYTLTAADLRFLQDDCMIKQKNNSLILQNTNKTYCKPFADIIACWGPVPSNYTQVRPCFGGKPFSWNNSLVKEVVGDELYIIRECNMHGQWVSNTTDQSRCAMYEELKTIVLLTAVVGYGFSLLLLFLGLIVFFYFKKLRKLRNQIHCHFFIAISVEIVAFYFLTSYQLSISKKGAAPVCYFFLSLMHYSHLAKVAWLLMEGFYLMLVTIWIFGLESLRPWNFGVAAWGLPFMLTFVWLILERMRSSTSCLHHTRRIGSHMMYMDLVDFYVGGPLLLSLVIDLGFCAFLLYKIHQDNRYRRQAAKKTTTEKRRHYLWKRRDSCQTLLDFLEEEENAKEEKEEEKERKLHQFTLPEFQRKAIISYLVIVLVFCFDYMVLVIPKIGPLDHVGNILATAAWALQGAFVAIVLCFLNQEVRNCISSSFREWRRKKNLKKQKKNRPPGSPQSSRQLSIAM